MDKEQLNALKELMGDRVILENDSLDAHRFDRWCIKHYRAWQQQTINRPACIVRPIQTKDVQTLMAFAHKQKLSVVPFGLGSGVCGGIEPSDQDILIDMGAGSRHVPQVNFQRHTVTSKI